MGCSSLLLEDQSLSLYELQEAPWVALAIPI